MPFTLSIQPTVAQVGSASVYRVNGGPPGASIVWSSTLDGVNTGENMSNYGQFLDAAGNFAATGDPWRTNEIGAWTKTVTAAMPDGSTESAVVSFTVVAAGSSSAASSGAVTPSASVSSPSGFLGGSTNILGHSVPNVALLGGAVLLVLALGGGGKR